jgi:hypothetical protein
MQVPGASRLRNSGPGLTSGPRPCGLFPRPPGSPSFKPSSFSPSLHSAPLCPPCVCSLACARREPVGRGLKCDLPTSFYSPTPPHPTCTRHNNPALLAFIAKKKKTRTCGGPSTCTHTRKHTRRVETAHAQISGLGERLGKREAEGREEGGKRGKGGGTKVDVWVGSWMAVIRMGRGPCHPPPSCRCLPAWPVQPLAAAS